MQVFVTTRVIEPKNTLEMFVAYIIKIKNVRIHVKQSNLRACLLCSEYPL